MGRVTRFALGRAFAAVLLVLPILADTSRAAPEQAGARAAEMVLLNGRILLFHGVERHAGGTRPKFAEAAVVRGGRFVFVGKASKAKRSIGPDTQVIDLEGRMVMPGIVDGHFHGTRLTDCDMGYAGGTMASLLAKLQACLDRPDQVPFKNSNVRLQATHIFGEAILPEGTELTSYDLDRLDTTRPVSVENADGHKFWMNSRAIENAKIDEKTPDPPEGQIGRDANAKPNGFFADFDPGDWGTESPVGEEAKVEVVRRTNADANRMGITSVFIPGGGEEEIARWAKIQDEGNLTLRVNLGLSASFVRGNKDTAEIRSKIVALNAYKKYARGLIEVSSVKVYCDGVMEYPAHTGAMLTPYAVNAGTPGQPIWKPGTSRGPDPSCSDAQAGFVELDKAGWQIHVHAIGNRATRDALDNFQAALEKNGARDLRHTITHLEAIDEADIPRFKSLGVVASMSLQWARRDAYLVNGTIGYIGEPLYSRLFPAGDLWRAGAVIAGGSDYPVDPLLPFVQIETAIDHTGEAVPGVFPGALSPREVIPDLLAVIKMHTINSAYQMHQERNFGSIDVGKHADLIVLSQNPFEVPTEKISETEVLLTVLGGKIVYRNAAVQLKIGRGPAPEGPES
jgi:predicted amidohydrolase YtcJ